MMLQLTYISTAAPGLADGAAAEILAASRRNNPAHGVTGLLLYDGHRFLQALEGEKAAVNATYDRIQADPRHRAMVLLSASEVAERAFGDWAMAAQAVAPAGGGSLVEIVDRLTAPLADASMRALFQSYARLRHAA